jgi:hypothetical protein
MIHGKNWLALERPELGVINTISDTIYVEEWRNPDLLPSIRSGSSLVIASDYGGEHQSACYRSISLILAEIQSLGYWNDLREETRKKIIKDSRRLSYKQLADARRARALVPFLRAANTIPGLLVTFLIDKRIDSLFCEDSGAPSLTWSIIDRATWSRGSFEKMFRVAHFGALLVAGLSAPGQDLLWITDQDEIVANLQKHHEATSVFAHVMSHYLKHSMGHFRLATTQGDDGSLLLEDLAAIPDLAAGTLTEVSTVTASEGGFSGAGIVSPLSSGVSQKAHAILAWLADGPHPLRRLTFCIDHVPPDGFKAKLLRTMLEKPIPEYN